MFCFKHFPKLKMVRRGELGQIIMWFFNQDVELHRSVYAYEFLWMKTLDKPEKIRSVNQIYIFLTRAIRYHSYNR